MKRAAAVFKSLIDTHGPDSVGFYVSGQCLTEEYYIANKLVKGFIGTNNIDTNSRLCMASSVAGHRRAFGEDIVPGVFEDLENGVRHLTPSKTPLRSLYGMVDSKMSHWLDKERQHDSLDAVYGLAASRDQVEEIDLHLLCHALSELCKDETLILEMLSLWEDDQRLKPSDFAEILRVDVTEVYKAKERLKKLTEKIKEEWLFRC